MTPDFYQRALQRISWLVVGLGGAGTVIAALRFGFRTAGGFLAGALISWFSIYNFREVAESLGGPVTRRGAVFAVIFVLRYGLIGAAVYVIVKYLEVSLMAVLAGLLVSAAAVVTEILYELIYART
jgi:hypothetical protein